MLNLVSLLVAAALVSLQCGLEARAQIDKLDLDNSLEPNVVPTLTRRKQYVRITLPPPATVQVESGDRLILECQVIGSPGPSAGWLRNGEPIGDYEEDSNEIIAPHPSSIVQLVSKLVVELPVNGDVYTCVATSGNHQETASTTVYTAEDENSNLVTLEKLFRLPSKPIITTSYENVIQEMGTNLVLPCRVHSPTKTQVEWVDNNNHLVYGNPRFKMLPSGDLLIMGLRWSDMGDFACAARNAYGTATAVSFLYPSKP